MCNSALSSLLFTAVDRLHGTPGEFSYRKCRSCRTVYQDPRVIPEHLSRCYPEKYYTHEIRYQLDPTPLATLLAQRKADSRLRGKIEELRRAIVAEVGGHNTGGWIGAFARIMAKSRHLRERAFFDRAPDELLMRTPKTPKALDVGCGTGYNLLKMARVGWQAEGVEWDPDAAEAARRVSRCNVREGDFRRIDLAPNSYGLILLSHVLEHIDEPISALDRIAELLAPGGSVVILYPNPESLGARLYRDAWFPWEVPRHLVLPSMSSLLKVARERTLVPVKATTESRNAKGFSALSRSYQRGDGVDEQSPDVGWADALFGIVEKGCAILGLSVGEEIAVRMRKCETHGQFR